MQKQLLEKGASKDYSIIETTLKGNYLLKSNWRKEMIQGNPNPSGNLPDEPSVLTLTPAGSIRAQNQ